MRNEMISQFSTSQQRSTIAMETGLLELFAPTCQPKPMDRSVSRREYASLWRADAIHRAKNMAQMTTALADVADHPTRRWLPPEVLTQAKRLSRAYDQLGIDDASHALVPCAALLTEIVARLADIFGRSRNVAIVVLVEEILLSRDVRRALLLMASELIINALKYGYPTAAGGTIRVSLAAHCGRVKLIVEDDGVGLVETYAAGHGGGLLEQFRTVLGATVTRNTSEKGHGFRVATSLPAL